MLRIGAARPVGEQPIELFLADKDEELPPETIQKEVSDGETVETEPIEEVSLDIIIEEQSEEVKEEIQETTEFIIEEVPIEGPIEEVIPLIPYKKEKVKPKVKMVVKPKAKK